jgi:hypothetical protein
MCPPLESPCVEEEGTEYATAFLARLRSNEANPFDLATLLVFLGDGPMLRGACAVLCEALRLGTEGRAGDDPQRAA